MKIALVKLSSLGDIMHALVCCQVIKKHIADCEIHWFVEAGFADILSSNPLITQVHPISLKPRRGIGLIFEQLCRLRRLGRQLQFDYIIDLQGLLKSGLVSRLLGRNTHGFDASSAREGLAAYFYQQGHSIAYQDNIVLRNVKLCAASLNLTMTQEAVQAQIMARQPFLFFSPQDLHSVQAERLVSEAGKTHSDKPHIVLIPSASTPERRIGISLYQAITEQIDAHFYLCWGDVAGKQVALAIQQACPQVKLLPRFSLPQLVAFFSLCDLSVGPDTGPANIMFGLNKCSLTLYADQARNPAARNTFINPENLALSFADLAAIDPVEVIAAMTRLLDLSRQASN